MMRLVLLSVVGMGCVTGDDLGAPRLAQRASNLVPIQDMGFDAANRPLGLLDGDHRQRLARLEADGWRVLEDAETYNVLDLGTDSDGSLLVTIGNLPPGSGVFQLAPNDKLVQIGQRLSTAISFEPFQSPLGDLYVSTVDGGRRLVHGATEWTIAKSLSQVIRTREAVYGMSNIGLERLDITDHDGIGTVIVPCAKFPVSCATIHFDGRDAFGRMYFHADNTPALWVLEAGADELYPLELPGATSLGSVLASPRFVVVEADVDNDDGHHSFLYILPAGAQQFALVDLRARPSLDRPVLAIDHQDTVYVAHNDWLGTIEID